MSELLCVLHYPKSCRAPGPEYRASLGGKHRVGISGPFVALFAFAVVSFFAVDFLTAYLIEHSFLYILQC